MTLLDATAISVGPCRQAFFALISERPMHVDGITLQLMDCYWCLAEQLQVGELKMLFCAYGKEKKEDGER